MIFFLSSMQNKIKIVTTSKLSYFVFEKRKPLFVMFTFSSFLKLPFCVENKRQLFFLVTMVYPHSSECYLLCSVEERKSYMLFSITHAMFRSLINRDSLIHSDKKLFNKEANDERIFTFEWKFIFYLFKKKYSDRNPPRSLKMWLLRRGMHCCQNWEHILVISGFSFLCS